MNADGYVSTGQDINGYNMFAYCGNNPIARYDSSGQSWGSSLSFAKTAISAIGQELVKKASSYVGLFVSTFSDRGAPIMDVLAVVGGIALTATVINQGVKQAIKIKNTAKDKEKEKVITDTSKKQYNYWTATITNGRVEPISPLTYTEARLWVASGNDLLCRNHASAIAIVKFFPTAKWDPAHGRGKEGYLNHYHLSSAHTNHIWYYGE